MSTRGRLWDGTLIAGGVLLAGLTLRSYRTFSSPAGNPKENKISPQDAESAVNRIQDYLQSQPEDFNAWSQLAIAYYNRGPDYYADGLNAVEKARSLGATSELLFYYAGVMYEGLGLPEYAHRELSKYLRHHPDDHETQIRLANLLAQQRKYEEAYALYKRLSAAWPNDPTLWFNFGIVSKEKGDLDGALACFDKVLQIAKRLPQGGLYQKGEIARLKGSDDQAIDFYEQELAIYPAYLPALTALEAAQRRKSLWKEARLTREKIAALKTK